MNAKLNDFDYICNMKTQIKPRYSCDTFIDKAIQMKKAKEMADEMKEVMMKETVKQSMMNGKRK
jgi:hypothetical protein